MRSTGAVRGRLLVVGNPEVFHVGGHLHRAARELGLDVRLCDTRRAFDGPRWLIRLGWRLRGRSPLRLRTFGRQVLATCEQFRPKWLLATGMAPLGASILDAIRQLGIRRLNYLTDDPWNPAHFAPWFLAALSRYDQVFSTRRANLQDLRSAGCANVAFLPFGYAPELHFPESPRGEAEELRFACDVVFAGGADRDRVRMLREVAREGFNVHLYGGYWSRFRETKRCARGHADPPTLRRAIAGAKVALCLVRRANRDGTSMRSFEIPAMKGCMLAEATEEHLELLGEEGEAALYFREVPEMLAKLRRLLADAEERRRLAEAANWRIVSGGHTYADRLTAMLGVQTGRASRPGSTSTLPMASVCQSAPPT